VTQPTPAVISTLAYREFALTSTPTYADDTSRNDAEETLASKAPLVGHLDDRRDVPDDRLAVELVPLSAGEGVALAKKVTVH